MKFRKELSMISLFLAAVLLLSSWDGIPAVAESEAQSNKVQVTFQIGKDEVMTTSQINKGRRVTNPGIPTRDGYYFAGWFTDEETTQAFSFNTSLQENTTLFAKWLTRYTFEAEYTDLDGKPGLGYSENQEGTGMIAQDGLNGNDCGASNGYFVSYLYYEEAFLEFNIESSAAVDDTVLILRLSVEFFDMEFTPENYGIYVNDTEIEDYTITLNGAYSIMDNGINLKRPFQDFVVSTSVHLDEGMNTIRLVTENGVTHSPGTMSGDSPMVDCIYLCTNDATLTWTPRTDNI